MSQKCRRNYGKSKGMSEVICLAGHIYIYIYIACGLILISLVISRDSPSKQSVGFKHVQTPFTIGHISAVVFITVVFQGRI